MMTACWIRGLPGLRARASNKSKVSRRSSTSSRCRRISLVTARRSGPIRFLIVALLMSGAAIFNSVITTTRTARRTKSGRCPRLWGARASRVLVAVSSPRRTSEPRDSGKNSALQKCRRVLRVRSSCRGGSVLKVRRGETRVLPRCKRALAKNSPRHVASLA